MLHVIIITLSKIAGLPVSLNKNCAWQPLIKSARNPNNKLIKLDPRN